MPTIALEWLAVGGLLVGLGAAIKYLGLTTLVAGYDRTSAVPDDIVADIAGNTVLRIGLASLAVGVVTSLVDVPSSATLVVGAVILLAVLRLVYRLNTYSPASST